MFDSPKPSLCLNIPKTGTRFTRSFFQRADALQIRRLCGLGLLDVAGAGSRRWMTIRRHTPDFIYRGNLNHLYIGHMPYHKMSSARETALKIVVLRNVREWYISSICFRIYQRPNHAFRRAICLLGYGRDYTESGQERRSFLEHRHTFPASSLPPVEDVSPQSISADDIPAEALIWYRDNFRKAFFILLPGGKHLGWLTRMSIYLLFKDPDSIFSMNEAELGDYFASGRYRRDMMCDVFLDHEQLSSQLCLLMSDVLGYDREIIAMLKEESEPLNLSPATHKARIANELDAKNLWADIFKREEIYLEYIYPLRHREA